MASIGSLCAAHVFRHKSLDAPSKELLNAAAPNKILQAEWQTNTQQQQGRERGTRGEDSNMASGECDVRAQ